MLTSSISCSPLTTGDVVERVFGESGSACQVEDCSIHVISQTQEPRWIIVGNPQRALPVLRSWTPWKISSRIRWSAVRIFAALNSLHLLPAVESRIARVDTSYWRSKLDQFPRNWSAVIHVGNPSHTRKAILFLIENGTRVVCVGKVPLAPASANAIQNEGVLLDLLAKLDYLPKVLFRDLDRGIVAQSWLDGLPVARGFTVAHLNLTISLATPGSAVRVSDCLASLISEIADLELPFDRAALLRGLELLDCDVALRPFVVHGDFAPWNLKWIRRGVLGMLDWEWAVPHGLPWQDICRYFFLDDVHFHGSGDVWTKINANELLQRYRSEFEIPPEAIAPLTMRYLLGEFLMEWKAGNRWLADYAHQQIGKLLKSVSPAKAYS